MKESEARIYCLMSPEVLLESSILHGILQSLTEVRLDSVDKLRVEDCMFRARDKNASRKLHDTRQ